VLKILVLTKFGQKRISQNEPLKGPFLQTCCWIAEKGRKRISQFEYFFMSFIWRQCYSSNSR